MDRQLASPAVDQHTEEDPPGTPEVGELVEGRERKIPLTYRWVPDQFLNELLVDMAKGSDAERKTPALVFAFNRDAATGFQIWGWAGGAEYNVNFDALGTPALFTGDAPAGLETRIVDREQGDLRANLLKVAHHGSATSTSQALLAAALCFAGVAYA